MQPLTAKITFRNGHAPELQITEMRIIDDPQQAIEWAKTPDVTSGVPNERSSLDGVASRP